VICFVGCIGDDVEVLKSLGLQDVLAIGDLAPDAAYSMEHADELLEALAEKWMREH